MNNLRVSFFFLLVGLLFCVGGAVMCMDNESIKEQNEWVNKENKKRIKLTYKDWSSRSSHLAYRLCALTEIVDQVTKKLLDKENTSCVLINVLNKSARLNVLHKELLIHYNGWGSGQPYRIENKNYKAINFIRMVESFSYILSNLAMRYVGKKVAENKTIRLLADKIGYNRLPDLVKTTLEEVTLFAGSHGFCFAMNWLRTSGSTLQGDD